MMSLFKINGESQNKLMEIIINEVRENRQDIKEVKTILREGSGKIAVNRESIKRIWWILGTGVTILIAFFSWTIYGG
jgi:hypothetical protein